MPRSRTPPRLGLRGPAHDSAAPPKRPAPRSSTRPSAEWSRPGPAGIRLQEVAADVGVSHPTVLHHFGSREALVKAVCDRSFAGLYADVVKAIGESAGGRSARVDLGGRRSRPHDQRAWARRALARSGRLRDGEKPLHLRDVVTAAHALRKRNRAGARLPPRIDTTYTVVLAALALVAESVLGQGILEDAGLDPTTAGAGFRAWFARLLVEHFERGAAP